MIDVSALIGAYMSVVGPMWIGAVLYATRGRKRLYPAFLLDKDRLHTVALRALPIIYVGQIVLLLVVIVGIVPNPIFVAFILGLGQLVIGVPLWNELYIVPDNLMLPDRGTKALSLFFFEALIVATVLILYHALARDAY